MFHLALTAIFIISLLYIDIAFKVQNPCQNLVVIFSVEINLTIELSGGEERICIIRKIYLQKFKIKQNRKQNYQTNRV